MGTEDKYWIKPGIQVQRIGTDTPIMTVEKLLSKSSGAKFRITGVLCHWTDKDDKYQSGTFHTKELVPYVTAL
jgi:uncharacterized protein YodC (DUF2158 family)